MTMLATVAQFNATTDKADNLEQVSELVRQAAEQNSELVVLPENAMYANSDATADIAAETEELNGPFVNRVRDLARKYDITVATGMTEAPKGAKGKPSNVVVVAGPDGGLVGAYRKVHLYDAFGHRESDRVQAHSPEALTFVLGGLTFGVMTCYDLRFPEMARFLVDAGSQALIVPSAWAVGPAKEDHWATLARARAIENTVYVLASGQTGPTCTGQSMIIDPMGVVSASAGEMPGVASAVMSSSRVDEVRAKNPSLVNRRFTVSPM